MIRFDGFDAALQFSADGPCSILVRQWEEDFIYLWHPDHSESYPPQINGQPFAGWRTKLRGPYPALQVRGADVEVTNHGSLFTFAPLSVEAQRWLDENVTDATWLSGVLVVEPRYALDLAEGMQSDGLILH